MELWGGHECTVNRVGDRYRDQTRLTGHHDRPGDLERFAAMGIRTLRYPALWERIAPDRPDERDWRWTDERMGEMARLGVTPILGLLHHGSGPHYTSLVADNFVELFADHAAAVARRYPHVADWTPINEPLTTARFSALYGHWYPHARDEALFWRALLNQVDGTRAAMRAIRRENPAARLIQTEDLGEHFSTPELVDVAAHLNHRRWATWDLLTGAVKPGHALWDHLCGQELGDRLRAIADDPCPPQMIGINYYPTSERFLDHRLDGYPFERPEVGYHDLTAMRVLDPPPPGLAGLLRQAWERYRIPLAVTESHLGCTREEQLRWLWQSWRTCHALVAEGVDVRALTAWALLGNVDWTSLLTREQSHYESGAFDVRDGTPRPTAVARLLTVLAAGAEPTAAAFPTLAGPGWWQRGVRLEHPSYAIAAETGAAGETIGAPLVVAGASDELARTFAWECDLRGLPCVLTGTVDLSEDAGAHLDRHRPWAVINAARAGGVVDAEHQALGPVDAAMLAQACAARHVRYLALLSDPALAANGEGLIVQSDRPPSDRGHPVAYGSGPIFAEPLQLVRACLDLLIDGERGAWRLKNGVADRLPFPDRAHAAQPPTPERFAA